MDRAATIAWLQELADDPRPLNEAGTGLARIEREVVNPTCGDRVQLALHLTPGVQLRGAVRGCSLSTAAAVVAARALDGRSAAASHTMITTAIARRLTGDPTILDGVATLDGDQVILDGDLTILAGLDLVPLRRRCVALPWQLMADLLAAAGAPD